MALPWEEANRIATGKQNGPVYGPPAPKSPAASNPMAAAIQSVRSTVSQPQGNAGQTLGTLQTMTAEQPFQFKAPEPFAYNKEADPNYQAALTSARNNIAQERSAANAKLRGGGQGKSSYSDSVARQVEARALTSLESETLPKLIDQAYSRWTADANRNLQTQQLNYGASQDRFSNLASLYGLQNQQEQQGFNNRVTEAGLTGSYMPEGAQGYVNAILALKQQAEQPGVTPEQMAGFRGEADQLRSQLALMGVDPNIVGYEADYTTALRNVGNGIPTLAARNQQYNQQADQRDYDFRVQQADQQQANLEADRAYQAARDQIKDEQYKMQFDEDVRRYGIDSALQRQVQLGNLSVSQANAALSRERFTFDKQMAQDDNARQWAKLDYDMANPKGAEYRGLNANQVLGTIRSNYTEPVYSQGVGGVQQKTGEQLTTDPNRRYQMFLDAIDSGLPTDKETDQVLIGLGLSRKEISEFEQRAQKEFGGGR